MKCEFSHAKQKGCKARIHIKVFGEDDNGEKEAKVIKKVEEFQHKRHICGEPNASRFHVMKVSLVIDYHAWYFTCNYTLFKSVLPTLKAF